MGLFGSNSPFDAEVDKATNENNTAELWDVIMEICDRVGHSSKNAKDCLRSIMRRLAHNDPHVSMQAITLLDACVNNCGKSFHLEIASREFERDFRQLLQRAQLTVACKLYASLKKWAEGEFRHDAELNLIPTLYEKLRAEGYYAEGDSADAAAAALAAGKAATAAALSKDPNVVGSQKEQDDIALAIELSLKEEAAAATATKNSNPYATLYAQTATATADRQPSAVVKPVDGRKVRALYDFEAAEDNELTFLTGEIIQVLDDSDANWWKGRNQRGEGLFPSNFVTGDLNEPETLAGGSSAAARRSEPTAVAGAVEAPLTAADIDEERIDRLLHLLNEANPEDPAQDTDEMLRLEEQVNRMQPLIDAELERVDRKHAQLTLLSSDLVDAINLYHMLMREPIAGAIAPPAMAGGAYGYGGAAAGFAGALAHGMQTMSLNETGRFVGHPAFGGAYGMPNGAHAQLPTHPMQLPDNGIPAYGAMPMSGTASGIGHQQQPIGGQPQQPNAPPQSHPAPQQLQMQMPAQQLQMPAQPNSFPYVMPAGSSESAVPPQYFGGNYGTPMAGMYLPPQQPQSLGHPQQQQQFPNITQPITNTILPPSADLNIPIYQQQR